MNDRHLPIPRLGRLAEQIGGALITLQVLQAVGDSAISPAEKEVLETCIDFFTGACCASRGWDAASDRDRAYQQFLERALQGELASPRAWSEVLLILRRVIIHASLGRAETSQCIMALRALDAQAQREVIQMRREPASMQGGPED
ncbi:hypothetical protein EXS71_03590 [Candidatus Uhrbacteria bacterium]|nr:hypothetical protein [Candidatus Uhrbacteria bacterium]